MDSLDRIFEFVNEASYMSKKKKSKKMSKKNRYDSGSFGMQAESSHMKKKKKLIGKQHRLDRNKNGKLDSEDFRMLRGESKEVIAILDLIKEAYQEELISEEAFLAIADPILRSLMEGRSVNFPDTYEMEDLDDAEEEEKKKKPVKKPPTPTPKKDRSSFFKSLIKKGIKTGVVR